MHAVTRWYAGFWRCGDLWSERWRNVRVAECSTPVGDATVALPKMHERYLINFTIKNC